jgi:hypothetical protein
MEFGHQMKEWIGLIGTVSGVIIGGLITLGAGHQQRKHDIDKEKRALLLLKYEELHSLLGELVDCVNILTNQVMSEAAFDSKFDPKAIKNRIPTERITMLIEFYVPELEANHEYIKKQVKYLYEHIIKHILEVNKTKQFKLESAAMASELSKATSAMVSKMKETLVKSASKLVKNA